MNGPPRYPSPAKINLFLHVVGRRPDGYHLLQTAFQFISLCDWLELESRPDGQVVRITDVSGVPPETDLTVRAALALRAATGSSAGVNIRIEKTIPMGGGLGGGSSNAATVLVVLNRLWGLGLDRPALARIGLALGADVPVFVHGHAAWGEGVGEALTPINPPEAWYALLRPDCPISTAAVFNDPQLTRNTPLMTIADFAGNQTHNDCEAVVRRHYPAVAEALDWLGTLGKARLTGTGSCVYAAYDAESSATRVAEAARARGWQAWSVRGLNRSPLYEHWPG